MKGLPQRKRARGSQRKVLAFITALVMLFSITGLAATYLYDLYDYNDESPAYDVMIDAEAEDESAYDSDVYVADEEALEESHYEEETCDLAVFDDVYAYYLDITLLSAADVASEQELRAAIAGADVDLAITVTEDFAITAVVQIPAGMNVVLHGGNTIRQEGSDRHFYVAAGATLTLQNGVTLCGVDNATTGGGVEVSGTFNIIGGAIQNNRQLRGGGVYVNGGGEIAMTGGAIINNFAYGTNANLHGGGGIRFNGDVVNFVMNGGIISGNTTEVHAGGIHFGLNSTLTMNGDAAINNNTVISDSGTGGAVRFGSSSTLTMNGSSEIRGNQIGNIAGATGNTAHGAGVRFDGGYGTMIMNNNALICSNHARGIGGGIYMAGGTSAHNVFTMNNNAKLQNNTASHGGGAHVAGVRSEVSIHDNALVYNNRARNGGGGLNIAGSFYMTGGHIYSNSANAGGAIIFNENSRYFNMVAGDITHNEARAAQGGAIHSNASGRANTSGEVLINIGGSANISFNHAIGGASAVSRGGGIYIGGHYAILTISDQATIRNNEAHWSGGGIDFASDDGKFIMNGGYIENNVARYRMGGGVRLYHRVGGGRVYNAYFEMNGGFIHNNSAPNYDGGGVFLGPGATALLTNGTIETNFAGRNGGGFLNRGLQMTVDVTEHENASVIFRYNEATKYGGGIWTLYYDNLAMCENVLFNNNTANAPHDHGADNRGADHIILAENSGMGEGGNPQYIFWGTVTLPGTHVLNNYDVNYTGAPVLPPVLDVAIYKSADRANLLTEVGENIEYTITVANRSDVVLAGEFVVIDNIDIDMVIFMPETLAVNGTVLTSAEFTFNPTTGQLRIPFNELGIGNTYITFLVEIRPEAAGLQVENYAILEVPEDMFPFPETELRTPPVIVPVPVEPVEPEVLRHILIYYYIREADGTLNRDMEFNADGREYFYEIDSLFERSAFDRTELDREREYELEGWTVYIDGEVNAEYLDKDVDDVNVSFIVPPPGGVASLAQNILAADEATIVGDTIVLVVVWEFEEEGEDTPPPTPEPTPPPAGALPRTGIESSVLLWSVLFAIALMATIGITLLTVEFKAQWIFYLKNAIIKASSHKVNKR